MLSDIIILKRMLRNREPYLEIRFPPCSAASGRFSAAGGSPEAEAEPREARGRRGVPPAPLGRGGPPPPRDAHFRSPSIALRAS